jgi:hydrogenase expression/formation protein HypD
MTPIDSQAYRDPGLSRQLIAEIHRVSQRPIRLMEVCGTHTVSIFRHGIRDLLPDTISLVSGPGCPVCVTAQGEIDAFIRTARQPDVIMTTFGDLMRVPGSASSLEKERAEGRDVRIVYSAMDALTIARENPAQQVVFLGVGFETTIPTIAATIWVAEQTHVTNFCVFSAHKIVPPALSALMAPGMADIDGFILPGHVSVIIGLDAYRPFFEQYRIPCVVAGFEPADILLAVRMLVDQIKSGAARLENAYSRAVDDQGNRKARDIMNQVFEPADAIWRGLGPIAHSGLRLRKSFERFDAEKRMTIPIAEVDEPPGCACGEVLTGNKIPPACPLYKTRCTPMNPVGPCMVSTEGTCAAYFRYHDEGAGASASTP